MRWWSRNGCRAGSSSVRTTSPEWTPAPCTAPTIGPAAAVSATAAGSSPPVGSRSSVRTPSLPATTTSPDSAELVSSRRIQATPASGGSISIPAISMIFGIEPRVAMPIPPQAVQSRTIPRVPGRVRRKLLVVLHSRSFAAL